MRVLNSSFFCARASSPFYIPIASSIASIKLPSRPFSTTPFRFKNMAQSHACCTVPPVVSEGYSGKGSYTTVDGLKTYATGASGAKTGILVVYDIFGFFPQTIQGADILATGDKERQYQVFMPG